MSTAVRAVTRLVDLDLVYGGRPPVKISVRGRVLLQLLYPPGTLPRGSADIGFGVFFTSDHTSFHGAARRNRTPGVREAFAEVVCSLHRINPDSLSKVT